MIPTLLFWENGNTWYGSKGNTRFFIQPITPAQSDEEPTPPPSPVLQAELWEGPMAKQYSQITATASFPLSQEGLEQLTAWLEKQASQRNP